MAEEIFSGYESPQSYSKRQKLLECVLTGNSKLYLGRVHTEDHLKKHSKEEVENSLTLFDMGTIMAPQNVFDHFAQTLWRRKLKCGDF